jgi:hypothetical protein
VATSDLRVHYSKFRDQTSRRSCQEKLHPALNLWPGIIIHGISLLSISDNSNDLFFPIRMEKPKTNKSRRKPKKPESDQFYMELPMLIRSMIRWMDHN